MSLICLVINSPSISKDAIVSIRKHTNLSISDIKEKFSAQEPVVSASMADGSFYEDIVRLKDIAEALTAQDISYDIYEVNESGFRSPLYHERDKVSLDFVINMITSSEESERQRQSYDDRRAE